MTKSKLLEHLNKEQLAAVTHKSGPLLIVAGAGTGKTTVITRKIAWLVEQGLAKPNEILALTFTEKAASEMEDRVVKLLPYGYLDLWISTFHSFAKRILDAHALDIGLPVNFRLLKDTDIWVLLRQNIDRLNLDYYRPLGTPTKFLHALIKHFSRAKDELITPQDYVDFAKNFKFESDSDVTDKGDDEAGERKRIMEIAQAYAVYQKILVENDALDFGDLINYTHELFKKRPAIAKRYQKQFKYILIDEFQDTNFAQYELIKLLIGEGNNITVVGDDDQSIYKFRGASVSNILKFKKDFPQAKEITLTENYRSRQNILDLAYDFIQQNNPDRLEAKLKISKKLESKRTGKGRVEVLECKDFHEEAEAVVTRMMEKKQADRESTWNDFAVLVRSNDAGQIFMDVFDKVGIPYLQVSRRGLFFKPVVADVIAYMDYLDNHHDSQSLYKVMNFPIFGFSHNDLAGVLHYSRKKTKSLYESLREQEMVTEMSEEGKKAVEKLLALTDQHGELAKEKPVNEVFVQLVADLKFLSGLQEEGQKYASANFLDQFYRKVKDFTVDNPKRLLHDFVEEMHLELAAGEQGSLDIDTETGPETVKIITVHSAKGLEFKYVFVAALADKKFPAIKRPDPIELPDKLVKDILPSGDFHIQEERRLFYVALTRAKDELTLSYAQDYGGSSQRKPSVFLSELGLGPKTVEGQPTGKVVFSKTEKGGQKKHRLPLPRRFSFTAISDFRKCPLEYKYRHILRVPEAQTASLSFGQTIHRTLENYLKLYLQELNSKQGDLFGSTKKPEKAKLPEFSKMKEFYEESWVDDWYEDKKQKEEYRKQGRDIIKNIFEEFKVNPPKPRYIEQNFKLGIGEYLFTGKIDRADQGPGGLLIVDYKTGSGKNRPLAKVDKEQLLIYQWAANEFLKEQVRELQYWYLREGIDKKSFIGTEKQIEDVKVGLAGTIEKIVDAVKNDNFEKYHKKHQFCKYVSET